MHTPPLQHQFPQYTSTSRFREDLSIYVPPAHYPVETSRFSPESPSEAGPSRTQSMWTASATVRSTTPARKEDIRLSTINSVPSHKSRFTKIFHDMRTMISPHDPKLMPIQDPGLQTWPPLHIEKRACCHDCPCHALKNDKKRRRRHIILICILVLIILYLFGNIVALNVRVFHTSSPPTQSTPDAPTKSVGASLSANAQQCLSQYVVNAPSNPSQYPCSSCLSVLQAVPSNFSSANPSDGQQITNAIQFCALRSVFESASGDGQSALKGSNWAQDVKFCAWSGVQCDGSGRVSSLSLKFPGVPASIPNELSALDGLQSLTVVGNSALPGGSLPSGLSSWAALATLDLESTGLTPLPDSLFSTLGGLTTLTLVKNAQMGNNLPATITQSSLQNLIVNGQALVNPLPALSGSPTLQSSLKLIDLSGASLTGVIPSTVSAFKVLTELHLDNNNLVAPLPPTFPSSLQTLTISNNTGLTGPVQGSFCSLPNLQKCDVRNTGLSASGGCGVCQFGSA